MPNRLAKETSPYLRQHAENPVDWYPWLEIIFADDKLGAAALVESVHRAYLPARVLAFAEDVPIGEGRHPIDGQPAAYVCRHRTCDAPVTSVKALLERCAA